jgi:chromosome segregation ATPase
MTRRNRIPAPGGERSVAGAGHAPGHAGLDAGAAAISPTKRSAVHDDVIVLVRTQQDLRLAIDSANELIGGLRRELETLALSEVSERKELSKAKEEIAELRHEATELRRTLLNHREALVARNEENDKLQRELSERERLLDAQREVAELHRLIQPHVEAMVSRSQEVAFLQREIEERTRDLDRQRDALESLLTENAELRRANAVLQKLAEERQADLVSHQNTAAENTELRLANAELRKLAEDRQAELVARQSELMSHQKVIVDLQSALQVISDIHESVLHSTSWTLTAPLRFLGRALPSLARFWRRLFPHRHQSRS